MGWGTKTGRIVCVLAALAATSCAESNDPVAVDAFWNLTAPDDPDVEFAPLATETCLGPVGQRSIVGARGETSCSGGPIIVSCEAIDRMDGRRVVFLEANIDDAFAFELNGVTVDAGDGSMGETNCNVTIIEDGAFYDIGDCGEEPPSMTQPCQLSNISTGNGQVSFDLECKSLRGQTGLGFDVGAVGGGPTRIQFSNCIGL